MVIATVIFGSCNEDEWLKEKAYDFYTPENSYVTTAQFKKSLNFLYGNIRNFHWNASTNNTQHPLRFSDLTFMGSDYPDQKSNNYNAYITANTEPPKLVWATAYVNIANANAIIQYIDEPNEVSSSEKNQIKGEALFFRAFWYKVLANLFGGVPITLEVSTSPRRDYQRATREETYTQCKKDLLAAISLLADIDQVKDGQVNKQVAQHLITEIYIDLKDYTSAINSATAVITNPNMSLMKTRFGSRSTEPGDPYWDLFQLDNQNRSSGNKEALLVLQFDYQSAGSSYGNLFPRLALPEYYNAKVDDNLGGSVPAFTAPTAQKGGRGIGTWEPTYFFSKQIWGDDFDNDYRNSDYMIVRDFRIDNPNAKGFGEWIVKDGWLRAEDTIRRFYPFVMKFSRVGYFPEESYAKNPDGSRQQTALGEDILINSGMSANASFMDSYLFRLADTYLLRAEAYLGDNQKDLAADDINEVRQRSNATPISADDVTIDYILDERGRELYGEEYRVLTLCRLGKMVERTRKYNPAGVRVGDHQNLWPIPYSEIERNIYVKMEQNAGY